MGTSPEKMKEQIADTRSDLSEDLDRLTERTSPRRVAHHRKQMVSRRAKGLRERVMGTPEDTQDGQGLAGRTAQTVQKGAGQAVEAVKSAPDATAQRTTGNPLAVGLIAFGAGLLAASVLPESRTEQEAGRDLVEQAQPAKDTAAGIARDVAEEAKESGKDAAQELKDTAKKSGKAAGEHARDQAQDVARETSEARDRNR